jgi:hypothetical protein
MASFNGENIFGFGVVMQTAVNPVARQQNAAPGVNGVAEIIQGQRGAYTAVSGRLNAPSPAGLAAAELTFMSYHDGIPYALVDTLGRTWLWVKLESFEPDTAPIVCDPNYGYSRRYTARFFHQFVVLA